MELTELKTHLDTVKGDITAAIAKRDADLAKQGEVTTETRKALTAATERLDAIKADMAGIDARVIEMEKVSKRQFAGVQEAKSYGEQFATSEAYAMAAKSGRASVDAVRMTKGNISGLAASAGALVQPMRRTDVIVTPDRPTFIRQLIQSIPTQSNAVEVMRQNVFTNAAALQAPGTASTAIGAGEFQAKAESGLSYDIMTVPIRTMAHYIPASRQILSDAPMLQRMIDGRLMYGLQLLSDSQLLYGNGANQNLTGIMVDGGVQTVGQISSGTTGDAIARAMLEQVRKAITKLQAFDFYNVGAVVVNPLDWEKLELAKGTDGHYIWVTIPNGGEPRLWRLPVIVSNSIAEGDFVTGDWTMAATIYDREQMDIRVSESHADVFIKNGVVILAEERYGFGIELPKGFCKGKFTVAA